MLVMIADDDEMTRTVLRTILQRAGHVVCAEADNGTAVLDQCNRQHPDVLFLDINMPGMSGFEVPKQLRPIYPQLHVIMISASSTLENVRAAAKFGIIGFLVKPFTPEKVLEILKATEPSI